MQKKGQTSVEAMASLALALVLLTSGFHIRLVSAQSTALSDCYIPNQSNGRIVISAEGLPAAFGANNFPWSLGTDDQSSTSRTYISYDGPNRYDDFVPTDDRLVYRFYCQEGEIRPVFLQSSRDENGGADHESNDAFISMNGGPFVKIFTRFENLYNEWVYSAELELNFRPDQYLEEDEFEAAELVCTSGVNTIAIVGRSNGYRIDFLVVGEPGVPSQDMASSQSPSTSEACPGSTETEPTPSPQKPAPTPSPTPEADAASPEKNTTVPSDPTRSEPPTATAVPPDMSTTETSSEDPGSPTSAAESESPSVIPPSASPDDSSSDEAACFPRSATVKLEDGSLKTMDELQIGDRVQVGENEFEEVFFFSHRDPATSSRFVSLRTSSNASLVVSGGHLVPVYLRGRSQLIPASSVTSRTVLLSASRRPLQVFASDFVIEKGLYHPHTPSGLIVVDEVLTSCYTTAVPSALADALLWPQKAWFRQFRSTMVGFKNVEKKSWWGRHLLSMGRQVLVRLS